MAGELIAIALGLLVGLSLGALGGGGSTLAVPILVFVAGLEAQDATTASLLVVGIASAFGVVTHFRSGNVRLGAGIAFGAAGIVGSRLGLFINRSLGENALLLAFSALILFVAARMYRSAGPRVSRRVPSIATVEPEAEPEPGPGSESELGPESESESVRSASSVSDGHLVATSDAAADRGGGATAVAVEVPTRTSTRLDLSPAALAKLALAATVVGLLTGLFGVGGGFAVVPALTLILKFPAKEAIGTSLVVIAINAAVALGMRAGDIGFDWAVVAPFLVTVTVGVLVGTRVANAVDARRLTRAFAVMLAVVAAYTALSTLLAA